MPTFLGGGAFAPFGTASVSTCTSGDVATISADGACDPPLDRRLRVGPSRFMDTSCGASSYTEAAASVSVSTTHCCFFLAASASVTTFVQRCAGSTFTSPTTGHTHTCLVPFAALRSETFHGDIVHLFVLFRSIWCCGRLVLLLRIRRRRVLNLSQHPQSSSSQPITTPTKFGPHVV